MKREPLERQIHLGVVQLLKLNAAPGVVYFHCPNERRTSPREGAFLKRMGVLAGVADFCLVLPASAVFPVNWATLNKTAVPAFLEIKRPGGRLSVAQEAFRDDVLAIGCLWALAYSTDQAAEFLKSWGALRSTALPAKAERKAA